jgi:hypothetical protein
VRCLADGGRPAPTFSWLLDDAAYTGTVENETGAQVLTFAAKPEDHGKTLTCVAGHPEYSEQALEKGENTARLLLNVKAKPVEDKQVQNFKVTKIEQPFNIQMEFRSNPEPTEVSRNLYIH